jgi:hypothetical protein
LKWEVADEKAGHSYYVYRGTSPKKMIPIRSAVKEREYLDTTSYLTGRSTYYYAIMAVNVTQDTSDFSPYVMYSPSKVESVQSPSNIGFEVINAKARLSWNDVRLNDDFIAGYALQRKRREKHLLGISIQFHLMLQILLMKLSNWVIAICTV